MHDQIRVLATAAGKSRSPGTLVYVSALLGIAAVGIAAALLIFDVAPVTLSSRAHAEVSALPLAVVALAYLVHQPSHRPTPMAIVKAALLVSAFLLWAIYQLRPGLPVAINDLAITLLVFDISLVIAGDIRSAAAGQLTDRAVRPGDRGS